MSIKIYYGRRIPLRRLNELLDYTRTVLLKAVARQIREIMSGVNMGDWKCPESSQDPFMSEQHARFEKVIALAREASLDPRRSLFDLDCGLNIWIRGRYAYIMPIMESLLCKALEWPVWVEDFCYWDNTDQPDGTTRKEWETRRRAWEKVCIGEGVAAHNARRLWFEVFNGARSCFVANDLWFRYLEPYFRKRVKHEPEPVRESHGASIGSS